MSLDLLPESPVPDVETFTQQSENNQKYNEILQSIKDQAMSKRDGYTEVISVNNASSPKQIIKTTKISFIDFNLTDSVLTAKLPNTELRSGDKCLFFDSQGLSNDFNCTIDLNGLKCNGSTTNPVLNSAFSWIELTFIHENIGWYITGTS